METPLSEKFETLKRDFPKEYKKYSRTMNGQVMSVEIDALYNVLVLGVESEYELTRRHEGNVRDILKR
jgi:hypothetical protein